MANTVLTLHEQHTHGANQHTLETKSVLSLFPGIYDTYVDGVAAHGPGVVIYAPETRSSAGYLPLDGITESDGMVELIQYLQANTPDDNHVPVMFIYKCGCVSGYVMTAGFSLSPGVPDFARVTAEIFGHLDDVRSPRFVGEHTVPNPWDIEL